MLKAAILFFYNIYNAYFLTLKDISTISCVNQNKIKKNISLAIYDFIEYGKTWYEKNFNTNIDIKELRLILDELWIFLNLPIDKSIKMNFEKFNEKFIMVNEKKFNIINSKKFYINSLKISEKIEKYYDMHNSLHIFLHKIRENEDCYIFYLWIDSLFDYLWKKVCNMKKLNYLENIHIDNLEWKITKEDISSYPKIRFHFL